jgi:hypothetical protein
MSGGSQTLWAITSYFNPAGFRSRLVNYRTFRKHLTVPLVAVELSFNGRFELQPGDAEVLVQVAGGDVLWQKERLLNVAIRYLPDDCDAIAWLDCDIIFTADDWAASARAALDKFVMVHLFSELWMLAPGAGPDFPSWSSVAWILPGVGRSIARGEIRVSDMSVSDGPPASLQLQGYAWAARRALIERHGLYDARVGGGGDRAIICAGLGQFDYAVSTQMMNDRSAGHYRAWGDPFYAGVRGKIGYIDGRIFHLWHGAIPDRRYRERHIELAKYGFDPYTDIALDARGCWQWNSEKPGLHDYMRSYFASRNEDGVPAPAASPRR